MRSCGGIHLKRTKTDRLLNRLVILVRCPEPLPWRWRGGARRRGGQEATVSLPKMGSLIPQTVLWANESLLTKGFF